MYFCVSLVSNCSRISQHVGTVVVFIYTVIFLPGRKMRGRVKGNRVPAVTKPSSLSSSEKRPYDHCASSLLLILPFNVRRRPLSAAVNIREEVRWYKVTN